MPRSSICNTKYLSSHCPEHECWKCSNCDKVIDVTHNSKSSVKLHKKVCNKNESKSSVTISRKELMEEFEEERNLWLAVQARREANRFHSDMCRKYRKGKLSKEKIELLNNVVGWTWNIEDRL